MDNERKMSDQAAAEFGEWCRRKFIESNGLIVAIAVLEEGNAIRLDMSSHLQREGVAFILDRASESINQFVVVRSDERTVN